MVINSNQAEKRWQTILIKELEKEMKKAPSHDIGRHYPEGAREHGPISAPYARQVLERIQFPQDKIEPAILAIKYHDPTFLSSKRPQIEAKILFDADKIDAFGAIGISRYLIKYAVDYFKKLKKELKINVA
ncbi:hypothetical protein L6255_02325 [Candidatus Parcubacteria bacterium]|nr:hypothetical protein [Patescibacteria group bacterium]MBU4381221.1 hypothetical protein [Patescibacteria group bacterium]MCG2689253.1 hypothetical protein [Candidatus Parcubacteria bacterium]